MAKSTFFQTTLQQLDRVRLSWELPKRHASEKVLSGENP